MESVTKKRKIDLFNHSPIYEHILDKLPFISQLSLVRFFGYPRGDNMYTLFKKLLCLALKKRGIDVDKFIDIVEKNKIILCDAFILSLLIGQKWDATLSCYHIGLNINLLKTYTGGHNGLYIAEKYSRNKSWYYQTSFSMKRLYVNNPLKILKYMEYILDMKILGISVQVMM